MLPLSMITNRGVRIWPDGHPETSCIEQWRLRFMHKEKGKGVNTSLIVELMQEAIKHGFDIIKTENLYSFDDHPGYSSAQG
jgi:isocitrate dehydrogenase